MLRDEFERQFSYLRLSITDVCNFRCGYCLPNGYQKPAVPDEGELSLREIQNLLHGFAAAGFKKVRFTGGEPTTRQDLIPIIECAAEISAYEKIALSTNGWNLKKIAPELRLAGLTHLNVSVDSLDPARFARLTGRDQLPEVMAGIEAALELQFQSVKMNAVLHQEYAVEDFELFCSWVKTRPVTVRFIELMKTQDHGRYHSENFISAGILQQRLRERGWVMLRRALGDGPAMEFAHPDYTGRIGIIAPHSEGFCTTCNRLRVTSRGKLRLCLFGEQDYSLRPLLQSRNLVTQIPEELIALLKLKPETHYLLEGKSGDVRNLSVMGG